MIAHTFLPLLFAQEYGSYTSIKRTATECALRQAGLSVILGAAQNMQVRVLSEELADRPMRINEPIVYPDTSMRARDPPEMWSVIAWEQSSYAWFLRGLH